ncbi:MAG TPA: zincin-like metallopeptidase domain-containing protein [Trichocoleus sp.]
MTRTQAKAVDKFQLLTDKLLTLMEENKTPWLKPWHSTPYMNAISGHSYRGVNPLLATVDVMLNDYQSPLFVGFTQAKSLGWKVKKGSKATWLVWGGTSSKEITNEETGEIQRQFFNAFKWLNVFNLDCIDDSDSDRKVSHFTDKFSVNKQNEAPRIELAEKFIQAQNAKVKFGGNVACYTASLDKITMPRYEEFRDAETYYATFSHELSHWTAHADRLNRPLNGKFGSQAYAFEELIAEISAAFICNELSIKCELEHHASYLSSWIQILKSDNKAFIKAATSAQKAARYLLSNAGMSTEEENAA